MSESQPGRELWASFTFGGDKKKPEEAKEVPKSPERSVTDIQRQLEELSEKYARLFTKIDQLYPASQNSSLAEAFSGADRVNEEIKRLQKEEDEVTTNMFRLARELRGHPDAPKDLPDFTQMGANAIAEHFGQTV